MIRNAFSFGPEKRKAAFRSGRFAMDDNSPQSEGLVGWWPLGVHGGNAQDWDYSGFKNHGIRTNGPTQKVVNHPRWGGVQVMDFNGTDERTATTFDPDAVIGDGNPFIIALWANHRDVTSNLISIGTPKVNERMYLGHISGGWFWGIGTAFDTTTGTTATNNIWQHVVLSYDGIDVKMYLNSEKTYEQAHGGTANYESVDLNIGSATGPQQFFDGLLNDVRIYNRAPPSGVISEISNEPWRLVYPIGVRTVSFAPAAPAGGANVFEIFSSPVIEAA